MGTAVSFRAFASFLLSTAAGAVPEPKGGNKVPPSPVVVADLREMKMGLKMGNF